MGVTYSFAHMGIHCNDSDACADTVARMQEVFGFPAYDIGSSVIVAGPMELTKKPLRGTAGHIGIECPDVEEAIRDLREKGVEVDESTIQYTPDGKVQSVYLQETFGGFACHLLRKRDR